MYPVLSFAQRLAALGYAPSTCANYQARLQARFSALGEGLIHLPMADLQTRLDQYFQTQACAFSTQKQYISALKLYVQLCHQKTLILRPSRRRPNPQLLILSRTEIRELIHALPNLKHQILLATLYSGGLRVSEIIQLCPEHIHGAQGYLQIPGNNSRRVPLSDWLWQQLQIYYREYRPLTWLFEGRSGQAYATTSIQRVFRQALAASGLPHAATVHTLRHSFAVHLLEQGTDVYRVHQLMGHHALRTTQRYLKYLSTDQTSVRNPLDWVDLSAGCGACAKSKLSDRR